MAKLTPPQILDFKRTKRKIAMLTAYDYPSARLLDAAGIDVLLVGDSLGNVVQGKSTTLPVTLDQMIYHAEMVVRAARQAMVVVDLPFPYCQLGPDAALEAAARVMKETQADAVKMEGGQKRSATVAMMVDAGIPVVGHCGLLPQSIRHQGKYTIQRQRDLLLQDVKAIEAAGAFCVVLECVEPEIAAEISQAVEIPTIGIGSGAGCDGQVLVFHDFLGFVPPETKIPKHVKPFADLRKEITDAATRYIEDVLCSARNG